MTICSICGKTDFKYPGECVKFRLFTHHAGDWVCHVQGAGMLTDIKKHENNVTRKIAFLILERMRVKGYRHIENCTAIFMPGSVELIVSMPERCYTYLIVDQLGQISGNIIVHRDGVPAQKIAIPCMYDHSYFMDELLRLLDTIL